MQSAKSEQVIYQFRVRGHLDGPSARGFPGLSIALEGNGDTVLTGPVVDQAALHGLLKKVRDLGVPLLSVHRVEHRTHFAQGENEMRTDRKAAVGVGVLYILGTVLGVLSVIVTGPVRSAADPLAAIAAGGTPIVLGALAVLAMGLALAMIPVTALPILKRHGSRLAVAYVVLRGGLETVATMVTAVGMLLLLPISKAYQLGVTDAAVLRTLGALLLDAGEIGSVGTIVFCLGASAFYFLLDRARLVPRWLSLWGLAAVIPYLVGAVLTMAHLIDHMSTVMVVLDLPMAVQEMVLAVWLIAKGFDSKATSASPAVEA